MKNNVFNRYIWLLNTLLQAGRLSYKEIKDRWQHSYLNEGQNLPLRTFHMHRNAVEEIFGVNIECDPSDGYKYYIEDPSTLRQDNVCQWLLRSFNINNLMNENENIRRRIILESIPGGTEFLSPVIDAMRQNKEIKITYRPFYKNEHDIYNIQPYCIKTNRQRWYLLGYCKKLNGIRHFALDRTISIELTEETFEYPEDFSPEEYYKNSYGIFVNNKNPIQKIVIRVYGQQCQYLRSLPLHTSQREISQNMKFCDFEYHLRITHEFIQELLGKGNAVEVLEPTELKNEILRSLYSTISRYNPKTIQPHDKKGEKHA